MARKWANNLRFLALKSVEQPGMNEYFPFPMPKTKSIYDLWLTEPGEFPGTTDYVAVSYYWQTKEKFPKYTVSDAQSSTPRPVTAPNEVLDRAIHFAAYHNTCFIWIDQVCINQDNRTNKELGIQSMDLVFQRAKFTAGILSVSVHEPRHAEALNALREARYQDDYGYLPPAGLGREAELSPRPWDIVGLFEILASDRWLTRAWNLQEATCAGAHLVLLLKCPKGRGWQGDARRLDGVICIDSNHLRAYLVLKLPLNPPFETPFEESMGFHRRLTASRAKLQNLALCDLFLDPY
jgi:Heterokaryon incompatibility protein (HET)